MKPELFWMESPATCGFSPAFSGGLIEVFGRMTDTRRENLGSPPRSAGASLKLPRVSVKVGGLMGFSPAFSGGLIEVRTHRPRRRLRRAGSPPRSAGASLKTDADGRWNIVAVGSPPRSAGASLKKSARSRSAWAPKTVLPRVQRGPH